MYPQRQSMTVTTRGLTLVELMVALALGVLLSAAMVNAYVVAKRHYFHEEQIARLQENGRYALRLLTRELDMVGFWGGATDIQALSPESVDGDCGDQPWALEASNSLDFIDDVQEADSLMTTIEGIEISCLDATTLQLATDVLVVKRSASAPSWEEGVTAANLTLSSIPGWYLRVANSHANRWVQLRPIDLPSRPAEAEPSAYWEAVSKILFIQRFGVAANAGEMLPTLCMKVLAGSGMTTRCLAEGIENLQLEFGVDTDGDGTANRFIANPTAQQLARASLARIYLLVRSVEPIASHRDTKQYVLGRTIVPAYGDNYLRRVFTTTVRLRNRVQRVG